MLVSTNEVFDGTRTDGRATSESDPVEPANAYGASKLAGERAAVVAYRGPDGRRTAVGDPHGLAVRAARAPTSRPRSWPPPTRLPPGEPLPVVADEFGSPTHAPDLAAALLDLVARADPGLYHLANGGRASRLEWASAVLARCRPGQATRPIGQAEYPRPSAPPRWGVLATAKAAAAGVTMRDWHSALEAYLAAGCP